MGVYTTFDKQRDEAKEKFKEAYEKMKEGNDILMKMLDPDTWGYSEMSDEFIEKLEAFQQEMLMLSLNIKRSSKIL